jgi:hypothetical protein
MTFLAYITWYCCDAIACSIKGRVSQRSGWMHKQAWASYSALQCVCFLLNFVHLVLPLSGTVEAPLLGKNLFLARTPTPSKCHGKLRTVYCIIILLSAFRFESSGHYMIIHGLRSIKASSSCSGRMRRVSCPLILTMKLVPPSLTRSSYVPSSFWFIL